MNRTEQELAAAIEELEYWEAPDSDLTPEEQEQRVQRARAMSPIEKLQIVGRMSWANEEQVKAEIRARYPNADEREVRLRAASRRVPADLMRKALGWDPDVEGY